MCICKANNTAVIIVETAHETDQGQVSGTWPCNEGSDEEEKIIIVVFYDNLWNERMRVNAHIDSHIVRQFSRYRHCDEISMTYSLISIILKNFNALRVVK